MIAALREVHAHVDVWTTPLGPFHAPVEAERLHPAQTIKVAPQQLLPVLDLLRRAAERERYRPTVPGQPVKIDRSQEGGIPARHGAGPARGNAPLRPFMGVCVG